MLEIAPLHFGFGNLMEAMWWKEMGEWPWEEGNGVAGEVPYLGLLYKHTSMLPSHPTARWQKSFFFFFEEKGRACHFIIMKAICKGVVVGTCKVGLGL